MAFIARDHHRDSAPIVTRLRHIRAKCGLVLIVAASVPLALLALPILLLTERSLKDDDEYWD